MYRTKFLLLLALVSTFVLIILPTAAFAANAFGRTYAGQDTCLNCHYGSENPLSVGDAFLATAHANMVKNVQADPAALIPAAPTLWPSPAYGTGLRFSPADLFLMIGATGGDHDYIGAAKGGNVPTTMGTTIPAMNPTDDYPLFRSVSFGDEEGLWSVEGTVSATPYFQSCGGCHNLGVTRPSNDTTTLANGATISPSTETSWTAIGIQCENCHGTGKSGRHWITTVSVLRLPGVLSAQVCGQCHVTGSTAERRKGSSSKFSNANGYTPDETLSAYFSIATPADDAGAAVGKERFYPDGHNKGMNHPTYNEWLLSGHAKSRSALKNSNGTPKAYAGTSCLKCHSAEAYFKDIGYNDSYFSGSYLSGAHYTASIAGDKFDITCQVCHVVHQGGGSEALGLRVERTEVCTQCHNAELEGGGGKPTPGSAVHHPQKEMLEGVGLLDVPDATKPFMGQATCVDCHMPKTKAQPSHRMTPMLPGNADDPDFIKGVPVQEDSCTKCHGSSRGYLQTNIDTWQDTIAGVTREATAALAAANARKTAGVNTDLYNRASTNVSFVQADKSQGVHNFPYAKAGLQKAVYFAKAVGSTIDLAADDAAVTIGGRTYLAGTLTFGDLSPAEGESVLIEKKSPADVDFVALRTVKVDADGEFLLPIRPTVKAGYRASWSPRAGSTFTSGVVSVNVRSITTIAVSRLRAPVGRSVGLSGSVLPAHPALSVAIQLKTIFGWKTIATRPAGPYAVSTKPTRRGTYYYRARFAGDTDHAGSVSATVRVVVY